MMNIYTEKMNSGVDWLGEIPKHWNVSSLKRVLSEPLKYGATEAGDCDDRSFPRYLRITDFDNDGGLRADTFASLPEEVARDYFLKEGDVLFARSGATVGKTFLFRNYHGRACFAGYLIKASPDLHKLTPEFLYYFTKSPAYEAWKNFIFTQATIQNIGADKYAYLPVCLPPVEEQQRIAAYLDASCAAIDAAVAAKRLQLETLDTLRKSTIHTAVTRGLNADAKMKPADLDWLSEVPAHWTPSRIKNLAELSPGYSERSPTNDEVCTVVPMELLSETGTMDTTSLQTFEDVSGGLTVFETGDVLFAKITPCMENGKGAFVENLPSRYAFGSTEFHVLRPAHAINGTFLYYYTYNPVFRAYAAENMSGAAGQKRVSSRFLKETRLFVPPLPEQLEIISFITAKDREFRSLFAQIEAQISTLTAYRQSLIHECVTGQRRITEADVSQAQRGRKAEDMKSF